jgi:hypothetical protein
MSSKKCIPKVQTPHGRAAVISYHVPLTASYRNQPGHTIIGAGFVGEREKEKACRSYSLVSDIMYQPMAADVSWKTLAEFRREIFSPTP